MTLEQENKRLRDLLRDCRMIVREVGYPKLAASIDDVLSQQAEQATAQDELGLIRAVLKGYPESIARNDALRAVRALEATRPAQTEQQPEQDGSLNMEPEGDNTYLVVDPEDNYHICYVVRSKDQALQHASDGLLAFGPLTNTQ